MHQNLISDIVCDKIPLYIPMSIDLQTLEKIARLAKLSFSDQDKPAYLEAFNKILKAMDTLSNIDTTSVEVDTLPSDSDTKMRSDSAQSPDSLSSIEKNAPQMSHGYFLVPKVIGS